MGLNLKLSVVLKSASSCKSKIIDGFEIFTFRIVRNYVSATKKLMKKLVGFFLIAIMFVTACGPKPYYKTAKGKKKQKYYNDIQYGGKSASQMKAP